jgi:hypothetical protein
MNMSTPTKRRTQKPDSPEPSATSGPATAKKPPTRSTRPVRDSFTFPESDYALFALLKKRALSGGCEIKKSELIRAGLTLLNTLSDTALIDALNKIERVKTGRPKK